MFKNKKKGFTLIELLAVIVILAVVALIAIPIFIRIQENARKDAFKASIRSIFESAQYKVIGDTFEGNISDLEMKNITNFSGTWEYRDAEKQIYLCNVTDGTYIYAGDSNGCISENEFNNGIDVMKNTSSFIKFITNVGNENINLETVKEITVSNDIEVSRGNIDDVTIKITENGTTIYEGKGPHTLDTSKYTSYVIEYSIPGGNTITRTVTIADQIKPVITLIGEATITISKNGTFTDEGATVTDNVDAETTIYATGGEVNTSEVGTYTLTYDYTDAAGNKADTVRRTVIVNDAPTAATLPDQLTKVTSGAGLYASTDTGEWEAKSYYAGQNPNNFLIFSGACYRIIHFSNNGTIKIIYDGPESNGTCSVNSDGGTIGSIPWDTSGGINGSNNWLRPATLNTSFNTWIANNNINNVLTIDFTSENSLVAEGVFDYSPCTVTIGPNTGSVTGCTGSTTDTKKIGLLTTAEYVRTFGANTGATYQTNFLGKSSYAWSTSTPYPSDSYSVYFVNTDGTVFNALASTGGGGVRPVFYLKSDITITGEGTTSNPFTVS